MIDEMEKHVTADRDTLTEVFFAPILKAQSVGLFRSFLPGSDFNLAFIGQADPKRLGSVANLKRLVGMEIERPKQIHRLCEFWEGELRLVIKPKR